MRRSIQGWFALCALLAASLPAGAQTFSYTFSSCASGVTMQVTLPVTQTIMAPPASYGYTATNGTFVLTINGSSQTFNGLSGANVAYSPSLGPTIPASTDVFFDPSVNQGGAPWS